MGNRAKPCPKIPVAYLESCFEKQFSLVKNRNCNVVFEARPLSPLNLQGFRSVESKGFPAALFSRMSADMSENYMCFQDFVSLALVSSGSLYQPQNITGSSTDEPPKLTSHQLLPTQNR